MEEDLRCPEGLGDPLTVGRLKAKDANHPSARSGRGLDAHQGGGQSTWDATSGRLGVEIGGR